MHGPLEQRLTGISGCSLALLIGAVTVAIAQGTFWIFTGKALSLQEEWGRLLFWAVFVAAPFCFLALSRLNAKTPWITAAILTAMLWGLVVASRLARPNDASIGLGLLMMISPLIVTAGAFAADLVARRLR